MSPPRPGDPRAAALLARFRAAFGGGIPIPVEEVAEDLLGLRVEVRAGLRVSGMLIPAEWRVLVSAAEPPERRRFTVAHEIGHWVVHCRPATACPPILCRPGRGAVDGVSPADPREREANVFAADLLMPEVEVRDAVSGVAAPDVPHLAEWFGVSEPAMGWRLYNLGLPGPRPPASPAA